MSVIVKYASGETYTVIANKVEVEKVQTLDGQYHIPNTAIIGMMRLGLGAQNIAISGDAEDMAACLWHEVVEVSLDDGVSYQTVYFSSVPYSWDCWSPVHPYTLNLIASPLKKGPVVRYPLIGYKWGTQSITGISQAGNVNAFPIIHYLAPLFYAPLSNTLIDFAGQSVTFTRTASKVHAGVTYPINTPIFDAGLYLGSDTAQDVATWTPPASTVRTVAMQLKSRYPSPWVIGGGGTNLLTANQSNAETNTTGMDSYGTLTRNTSSPIAGTADFKVVSGATSAYIGTGGTLVSVTAGRWYTFQVLVKGTGVGTVRADIYWYASDGTTLIATTVGASVGISVTATLLSTTAQVPSGAAKANLRAQRLSCAVNDVTQVDSLMLEVIPTTLTVWTVALNKVTIDTVNNLIKWTDDTTTVSLALPAAYLSGTVMDVVVIDDTAHAVTIAVHPAGGSWTSATGTLALLTWLQLTLGNLEGSIANLIQYPYVLTSAEYQTLAYSSLSLLFNTLYVGNRYAGEIIKGSDKRLVNANGSDISALLGGTDIAIGASAVTIAQSQGLSARWYVEVKRTDV